MTSGVEGYPLVGTTKDVIEACRGLVGEDVIKESLQSGGLRSKVVGKRKRLISRSALLRWLGVEGTPEKEGGPTVEGGTTDTTRTNRDEDRST